MQATASASSTPRVSPPRRRHRDALARLSRERIRAELLKLLAAPGAPAVMDSMGRAGIATVILAGPFRPERLFRLVAFEVSLGDAPDALLRLAAAAVNEPADADRLRGALRLSNSEHARLSEAVAARGGLGEAPPSQEAPAGAAFQHGRQASRDGLRLAAADGGRPDLGAWRAAATLLDSEAEPRLPLGGADILARGVTGGRTVGAVLKRLQAAWIRAGSPRTRCRCRPCSTKRSRPKIVRSDAGRCGHLTRPRRLLG